MNILPDRQTERLSLTRPQPADVVDLLRMYRDPRVMATLGGVCTDEEAKRRFGLLFGGWEERGFDLWIARDRQTGQFVGRGGLRQLTLEGKTEVEVGYGLMAEFWGQGLATELAQESVQAGFLEFQRPDLVCFTLPTNRASQHVMEKVGFRYEREGSYANLPHVFYRLTVEQWRTRTLPPERGRQPPELASSEG